MSVKEIQVSQYSVGKHVEELLVPTVNCPIKRHGLNDDCICIHKNRYTEYTAPCPYYKGYKEEADKKETIFFVKCEGEGKPVIPIPERSESKPIHSHIKVHHMDSDDNEDTDESGVTVKPVEQEKKESNKDTTEKQEPTIEKDEYDLFDFM